MNELPFSLNEQKISEISKKYGLIFVILFGSRARGDKQNVESDLDIAVLTEKKPDAHLFGELYSEFSDIFPHEQIDLRFLNDADLLFQKEVVYDGVLLFGDKETYMIYKLSTIKRFTDDGKKYFPFLKQMAYNKQKILEANRV